MLRDSVVLNLSPDLSVVLFAVSAVVSAPYIGVSINMVCSRLFTGDGVVLLRDVDHDGREINLDQ